ncbi:MAG: prepilin-type N-terminal cleavage/methylation domain-containing protein [Rhodocyclales bacterium]|jgi:prepilin-type N-terminal cleavage/methylation domain-containing protein|nr:prepilin-type N-terminal cleavage/methylation domain-containing protein [Rhodocyclales bacterium]
MRSKQSGFTLVEIAIVLVIIGLLLGGVLKGQELINSAKVKNMIGDFRSTSTFVFAYQDRFRSLPGDDVRANANHGGTAATTPAGTLGNARINGNWNSLTPTDESYLFWQHVRLAGLATGDPAPVAAPAAADLYNPRNADGGRMGITGDPVITTAGAWVANFYICSAGIQGRFARQIDTTIDDGNTLTGTVRVIGTLAENQAATTGVANAATGYQVVAADDATLFTVCVAY